MNDVKELIETGLGDWSIASLRWNDPTELVIEFVSPQEETIVIEFREVAKLRIDFDYGGYSGMPFLFEVVCNSLESGYELIMEFGGQPDGHLSFSCQSAVITRRERQSQ